MLSPAHETPCQSRRFGSFRDSKGTLNLGHLHPPHTSHSIVDVIDSGSKRPEELEPNSTSTGHATGAKETPRANAEKKIKETEKEHRKFNRRAVCKSIPA